MNQAEAWYEFDSDSAMYALKHSGIGSKSELAVKSGVSRGQLYHLLNGKIANPSASTVIQLADALGCEPIDLMRPTR